MRAGRGFTGKTTVAGARDRETNHVSSAPVPDTSRRTLEDFVVQRTTEDAMIYTDSHAAYSRLPNHEVVVHGAGEYVRGDVHTNGIESHWAMLKRGIMGIYHQISPKHLHRYAAEFDGRHNDRPSDTVDQVRHIMAGMGGKRLRYQDLVAG